MPITTSNYTASGNTKIITISGEIGSTDIIAAVESAITGMGWSLYDTVTTTLFNPIVTKVYRVLNADGIIYKYLIIRWDTLKLFFYTSCCESWNTGTQQPLNESWTQAGGFAQGYDPQNSFIILSATARHIMIWNWVNSQPGLWTAIMEFEPATIDSATGPATGATFPNFAWTSSVMIGTPWGVSNTNATPTNTPSNIMFAFPRTPDGLTGAQAAGAFAPVTNKGMWPPMYPQNPVTITGDTNFLHLGSYFKSINYGWQSLLNIPGFNPNPTNSLTTTSPFSVDGIYKSMPFGRAYNFGVYTNVGRMGDTVLANVDPTGGWPSSNTTTSTSTECLLLPMNGGNEFQAQSANNNPQYGSGYASLYSNSSMYSATFGIVTTSNNSLIPGKAVSVGDTLYFAASDGIRSVSSAGATLSCRHVIDAGGVYDIVFDGQRTIYGGAGNGIVKLDTFTGNVQYVTSANTAANGCGYLGIDNKNVYASARLANTAPTCVVLDRATFTLGLSNVFVHTGTLLTTASSYGTPVPDYTGNVFVCTQGAGTTMNTYVSRFNANTGANVATQLNPRGVASSARGGDAFWYDYITNRLWLIYSFPASFAYQQVEYFTGNLTQIPGTVTLSTNQGSTNGMATQLTLGTASDSRGDLNIIPFRGMHFIQPKQPWAAGSQPSFTAVGMFTTFLHPNAGTGLTPGYNTGNVYPSGQFITSHNVYMSIANGAYYGLATPFSGSGGLTTNGCQLFYTYNNTINPVNHAITVNGIYNTWKSDTSLTGRLLLRG
jgi:hypothetical protein